MNLLVSLFMMGCAVLLFAPVPRASVVGSQSPECVSRSVQGGRRSSS